MSGAPPRADHIRIGTSSHGGERGQGLPRSRWFRRPRQLVLVAQRYLALGPDETARRLIAAIPDFITGLREFDHAQWRFRGLRPADECVLRGVFEREIFRRDELFGAARALGQGFQ